MLDVERLIAAGTRTLWFPLQIESRFEAETVEARRRNVILNNVIGLVTYEAFLFSDCFLVGDVFRLSLFIHVAVMLPTMGLVNLVVARTRRAWLRETVLAAGIVLTTAAILLLTVVSTAPHRDYEHFSIVLAILFATIVQRIRFWYVAVACIVSLVLTASALSVVYAGSPDRMLFADATFACVVMFALVGSYNLEREQRMSFLLRLKDEIRTTELEASNLLDPLTRVGNRRALELALLDEAQTDAAVAILLVDIDHFKSFNDTNGHQAGDVCLAAVAFVIATAVRRGDTVYRFGGEEFLVLMPATPLDDALVVAERIRAAIALEAIRKAPGSSAFVTVSVGAAGAGDGWGTNATDIIAAAVDALYSAKREGRDRVGQAHRNPRTLAAPS